MSAGILYSLTTADGYTEVFPTTGQALPVVAGLGAPPTEFQTYRGYKHLGETELGYGIPPRLLTVELWAQHVADRQAYWDLRARFLDFIRPNRGGDLVMTVQLPDGGRRSIGVRPNPGLVFPPVPEDNSWMLRETVEFVAHDPIFYEPDAIGFSGVALAGDEELAFPIEFPIWFGADAAEVVLFTGTFEYGGTWETFPVFELTGPYTWARIQNSAHPYIVALSVPIGAGEKRYITLTPGRQSIRDGVGNTRFGELDVNSNLVDFAILPDPLAANGDQAITVIMADAGAESAAAMTFNRRYFAL